MRCKSVPLGVVGSILLLGVVASWIGACGEGRGGFDRAGSFDLDSGIDSSDCPFQCSLDRRSVIRACTGEVAEQCPIELACGAGACQAPCAAAAADKSSDGCEFYLQPARFMRDVPQSCYAAFIVNTSTIPVDVALELEGQHLDTSKSLYRTNPGDATLLPHRGPIEPGASVVLFVNDRSPDTPLIPGPAGAQYAACPNGTVPASLVDSTPDGTGIGTSYRITTNAPVALSAMYPFGGSKSYLPSATLLLPVATWGKEHILINGWGGAQFPHWPAAQIVASEDDTDVTIVPTADIQNGKGVRGAPKSVPATYHLNRGQHLQLVQFEELSGSIVTSNKPASVFGGHNSALVPTPMQAAGDAMSQQIPPFEQWGSEHVGVGYRPRRGNEGESMPYRIVAARDGTRLEYDPAVPAGAPTTMSAGEVATFYAGVGEAFVVRTQDAEHPIYLAACMVGGGDQFGADATGFAGMGDPEFVNVIPTAQYRNSYSFFADPTYAETSLVIVRSKTKDHFDDVWLECAGNLTGFQPVGTKGNYEWTRIDLIRGGGPGQAFGSSVCRSGLQRMRSQGPFTATLWGWDYYASYAYPGGSAQRRLVESPLAPVH
jgi:IgGFc binding protein